MDRWKRLEELFHAARSLAGAERASFLARECGDDAELLAELEALMPEADPIADGYSEPEDLDPGLPLERIGDYRIIREIGEGGMGMVYLAEQEQPIRRMVAIKVIKVGGEFEQVLKRFEAEQKVLALMDHPGIARILDAGATEQGHPYFVMEYVPGPPITLYCDARQLSVDERLELFCQACLAIHHAHQKGIVHRDLKPSNILVHGKSEQPIPKVIDFGVARATQRRLTEMTIYTERGDFIGTPEYMSPEQADPLEANIDARSDVYSLGVILYELLTGCLPFSTEDLRSRGLVGFVQLIQRDEPLPLNTRIGSMPPEMKAQMARNRRTLADKVTSRLHAELDWITQKALAKQPADRYQSAADFAEDIRRHLSGQPVEATRPSVFYRLRKFAGRHRTLVASGSAFLTVAAIGTGIALRIHADNVALRERHADVQARLLQAQEANDQAQREIVQLREEVDRVAGELRDTEQQLDRLDGELKPLRRRAVALQGELDALRSHGPRRTPEAEPEPTLPARVADAGDPDSQENGDASEAGVTGDLQGSGAEFVTLDAPPPLPAIYAGRRDGRAGLPSDEARAIDLALHWLLSHQEADGHFDADAFDQREAAGSACGGHGAAQHDVGVTALAALALLGDGAASSAGPENGASQRAVDWLIARQQPSAGLEPTGLIGSAEDRSGLLDHAIATVALCEGYGFLGGRQRRDAAQRAIDYLELQRDPTGGWREESTADETALTAWGVMAYATGRDFGLRVSDTALATLAKFCDRVTDPYTGEAGPAPLDRIAEAAPLSPARRTGAFTAATLYASYLLAGRPPHLAATPMIEVLAQRPPNWDESGLEVDLDYWLFGAHALRASGRSGDWTTKMRQALVGHQRDNGHAVGSWDPVGVWGSEGGRVFATAMGALALQTPYRLADTSPLGYLPDTAKYRRIRRHWETGRYDRVHLELRELERGDNTPDEAQALATLAASIDDLCARTSQRIELLEQTDRFRRSRYFIEAQNELGRIVQDYRGLPPAKAAERVLLRYRRELRSQVQAAEKLHGLIAFELGSAPLDDATRRTLVDEYQGLRRSFRDTIAADEARDRMTELRRQ